MKTCCISPCLWAICRNKMWGFFFYVTISSIYSSLRETCCYQVPSIFVVKAISSFSYPLWGITIRQYVGQARRGAGTAQTSLSHPSIIPSTLPLDHESEHMFSRAACHLSRPAWVFNEHVIRLACTQIKLHLHFIITKQRRANKCKRRFERQTQEWDFKIAK